MSGVILDRERFGTAPKLGRRAAYAYLLNAPQLPPVSMRRSVTSSTPGRGSDAQLTIAADLL